LFVAADDILERKFVAADLMERRHYTDYLSELDFTVSAISFLLRESFALLKSLA